MVGYINTVEDMQLFRFQGEQKMEIPENVRLNEDAAYVEKLKNVMAKNGGYCPCRIQHIPDNICICKEFREQLADPDFTGFCHCKLYYKEK